VLSQVRSRETAGTRRAGARVARLRVPIEQEIGNENLAFGGIFVDGQGRFVLIEIQPRVEDVRSRAISGEAHQCLAKPGGCVALLLPWSVQGVYGVLAAALVLLAAATGAGIIAAHISGGVQRHWLKPIANMRGRQGR
jgi:hypothetical protein